MRSMVGFPSKNLVEGSVEIAPLGGEAREQDLPVGREAVEALVAPLLFAPLAGQQALTLEAAKQRGEGALINLQARLCQRPAQGVAVPLGAEFPQHPQHQAPTPELEAEFVENVFLDGHV